LFVREEEGTIEGVCSWRIPTLIKEDATDRSF